MMSNKMQQIWERFTNPGSQIVSDLDEIGFLQRKAARCRAELTDTLMMADRVHVDGNDQVLEALRKKLETADDAHLAALREWESKQASRKQM